METYQFSAWRQGNVAFSFSLRLRFYSFVLIQYIHFSYAVCPVDTTEHVWSSEKHVQGLVLPCTMWALPIELRFQA